MCGQFDLMAKVSDLSNDLDDFELENPEFIEQLNMKSDPSKEKFHYVPSSGVVGLKMLEDNNLGNKLYLDQMRWGLLPNWTNDIKTSYKMFNARIETIFEKKSFSGLIRRNRCVIIGSSYFEWQKIENSKKKIKFQFTPENLNLFYFAGLYNNWVDRTTGEVIPSVTMITKPAIEQITHIHDRMPAILSQNQLKNWLSSDIKSAKDIDFLNNQEIGINFQEVA